MPKVTNPDQLINDFGGPRVWLYDPSEKKVHCIFCDTSCPANRRSCVISHVESKKHQAQLVIHGIPDIRGVKLEYEEDDEAVVAVVEDRLEAPLLFRGEENEPEVSEIPFAEDLCRLLRTWNVPLNKVEEPDFVRFLEKYAGAEVPNRFMLAKIMEEQGNEREISLQRSRCQKTGKTYRFWDHFVKHSQELSPMYGPKTDFNRFSSPRDGWLFHHKDNLDLHQRILKFEHGQAQDLEVRSHLNEGPGPFVANSPLEFLAQREKMKLLKDKLSKELTIEEDRHDRFKRKNLETIGKPRPYFPPWDHLAQEGPSRIKPRPKHRGWTHGDDSESWFLEAKTRGAHDDYMDFYQDRMDCHLRTPQAGNMALAY